MIDPVDGTYNFVSGLPAWCSALALTDGPAGGGELLLGAIYQATTDELWVGGPTRPPTLNGVRLPRLADRELREVAITTYLHPPRLLDPRLQDGLIRGITSAASVRIIGSGSIELAAVAAGRLGVWLHADPPLWDWLPGAALVTGVGGVTDIFDYGGHRSHQTARPPRSPRSGRPCWADRSRGRDPADRRERSSRRWCVAALRPGALWNPQYRLVCAMTARRRGALRGQVLGGVRVPDQGRVVAADERAVQRARTHASVCAPATNSRPTRSSARILFEGGVFERIAVLLVDAGSASVRASSGTYSHPSCPAELLVRCAGPRRPGRARPGLCPPAGRRSHHSSRLVVAVTTPFCTSTTSSAVFGRSVKVVMPARYDRPLTV